MLVANMICPLIMNKIFFRNYQAITVENTIKLLYRAKKLYEARQRVVNILKKIVEIDLSMEKASPMWRILQQGQKCQGQGLEQVYHDLVNKMLKLISRTLSLIDGFKEDNKMFPQEFTFRGKDYIETLLKEASIINGFLMIVGLPTTPMEVTGIVIKSSTNPLGSRGGSRDANRDLDAQREAELAQEENYNEWFQESIEVTGMLKFPILNPLSEEEAHPKVSKIDQAVA